MHWKSICKAAIAGIVAGTACWCQDSAADKANQKEDIQTEEIDVKNINLESATLEAVGKFIDDAGATLSFQAVAAYSEKLWRIHYNRDEKKVVKYKLPPIVSKTKEEWEGKERPETLQLFKDIMYGQMPGRPDSLTFKVMSVKEDALDGLAVRKEIRIISAMKDGRNHHLDMLLYVPRNAKGPSPVFVGLAFSGYHAVTPEKDVRVVRGVYSSYDKKTGKHALKRISPTYRSYKLEAYNVVEAVQRGYAVAIASYLQACPDHLNGMKMSPFALLCTPEELRSEYEIPFLEAKAGKVMRKYSIIGAWAWCYSRMLDALENEPLVDATKAITVGHSRLGKTALWAAATDQRFAGAISNNSGSAGAKLSRRNFGENLRLDYWEKGTWLCGKIVEYIDNPEELPFDQHQLLALIATRGIYVASATEDLNADPKGEFLSLKAASPAWKLYGMPTMEDAEMPGADTPIHSGVMHYHLRTGKHAITVQDWKNYYDFADRLFGKKK